MTNIHNSNWVFIIGHQHLYGVLLFQDINDFETDSALLELSIMRRQSIKVGNFYNLTSIN
jgi:L-arabinose isomerase